MTPYEQIAAWLTSAKSAVAFTGAGISTESGIPDFRSPGGVWATSTPVMYQDFLDDADARYEYWRQKSISHADFMESGPNVGHQLLAQWEQAGLLNAVITQNIDGLHHVAGSYRVLELHGTAREIQCLDCNYRGDADPWVKQFLAEDAVPPCPECTGRLKHATISFGQQLDPEVLQEAAKRSENADLYIVLGSSLVVEPAATLPLLAKRNGAKLVIINRDSTPHDRIAHQILNESIGDALSKIADHCPQQE